MDKQKVIDIYNNLNIRNWDKGKNVTHGWVNVNCPFCADPSNHCGVNPSTLIFNCWRCGMKGGFVDLLVELTGFSITECERIIKDSTVNFKQRPIDKIKEELYGKEEEIEEQKRIVTALPKTFEPITWDTRFSLLDEYLERRKISRHTLIEYGCGICRAGDYMNRCIIPVYYQGRLVSYQAADLTGFADLKYDSAPKEMGVINHYLYGLDEIKKRMIVVEGVLDKWRTGKEAVAAFTSTLTPEQFKLIIAKELDELYFCFDPEVLAYYKAKAQAEKFRPFISTVEVVKLPFGKDPDELGREKVYECILETHM
jgi:hypothetical protein